MILDDKTVFEMNEVNQKTEPIIYHLNIKHEQYVKILILVEFTFVMRYVEHRFQFIPF